MLIRVMDFETTGFPPNAGIVEVGWTDVIIRDKYHDLMPEPINIGSTFSHIVDSGYPISLEAMAVHHITEAERAGKPQPQVILDPLKQGVDFFCAHNAKFDSQFWNPGKPWICTYRAAQEHLPGAPSYKNQVLRYFLDLPVDPISSQPAHRAGPDTHVTAHLLVNLLNRGLSPQDLASCFAGSDGKPKARLLETVAFGKHKGKAWSMVPTDYMLWLLANQNPDDDVRFTMNLYLKQRGVTIP